MRFGIANVIEVDRLWPDIVDGMATACKRGGELNEYTPGDLWQMCRSGHAFLIVLWDDQSVRMSSVWRFERKSGKPVFRCVMMHGTGIKEWVQQAREQINAIAKQNGAQWLVATGRRGWLRYFSAAQWGDDYAIEVK